MAKQVATLLDATYIELDALHWDANWTEATAEVFRARVSEAMAARRRWVIDGNYTGKLGYTTLTAADTVIWLDYPFPRVCSRLFVRTLRRALRKEVLWNGNREILRSHFFTRDSLFWWAFKSHWRHRREYAARFVDPQFAHVRLVRLRTPGGAERYLTELARASGIGRLAELREEAG